jgi:hypothetical protein
VANVYLVCEGQRDGLDQRVLDRLVVQARGLSVLVEPAGGDSGVRAVRTYLDHPPGNVALSVEDRNYRLRADADATWANTHGRRFIWRRHEIENYLLEPAVVLELFDEYRRTVTAAWVRTLPMTQADVSSMLEGLARPLIEDHAAKVLCAELVRRINAAGGLSFGPASPAPPPGSHSPGQAQWLPVVQNEAARLCSTCSAASSLSDLQPAAISSHYHALLTQHQAASFVTSGDYLVDMGGHELMAALSRFLHSTGAPTGVDQNTLADSLIEAAERIYRPGLFVPDDFADLANILAQY